MTTVSNVPRLTGLSEVRVSLFPVDGVEYGMSSWSSFVEVKIGDHLLTADQVNAYWDLGREWDVDHVLTIS